MSQGRRARTAPYSSKSRCMTIHQLARKWELASCRGRLVHPKPDSQSQTSSKRTRRRKVLSGCQAIHASTHCEFFSLAFPFRLERRMMSFTGCGGPFTPHRLLRLQIRHGIRKKKVGSAAYIKSDLRAKSCLECRKYFEYIVQLTFRQVPKP